MAKSMRRVAVGAFLCAWIVAALPVQAATVTGNLKQVTGATSSTRPRVTFAPMDTPTASGLSVVLPQARTVQAAANGDFTAVLLQGSYRVSIDGLPIGFIRVPAGDGSYNINTIWGAFVYLGDPDWPTNSVAGYLYNNGAGTLSFAPLPGFLDEWSVIDPDTFSAGGGAVWGSISGTLANQTDIQAALDLKASLVQLNTASNALETAKQPASANLTNWSAIATSAKQDASANLTSWSAIAPGAKQNADTDLDSLASGITGLVQGSGNGLGYAPASSPNVQAALGNVYQGTNGTLTRLAGIGPGTSGDVLYRDATGWTNLPKGTDGQVLKLASGLPIWDTDAGGGAIAGTVVNPSGTSQTNLFARAADATGTNIFFDSLQVADVEQAYGFQLQPASANLSDWSLYPTNAFESAFELAAGASIALSTNAGVVTIAFTGSEGGEANTASNLGSGQGVFANKTGIDLRFYSFGVTNGLSLALVDNVITFGFTNVLNLDEVNTEDLTVTGTFNSSGLTATASLQVTNSFKAINATANRPAVFDSNKFLTNAVSGTDGDFVVYDSATAGGIKNAAPYAKITNALAFTGSTSTYLRSDGTHATPPGGGGSAPEGTVVNTGASVSGYMPTYTDTTGTNIAPTSVARVNSGNFNVFGGLYLSNEVKLITPSTNILALHNDANSTTLRIHHTWQSDSDNERMSLVADSTSGRIVTASTGAGSTTRPFGFGASAEQWRVATTGNFGALGAYDFTVGDDLIVTNQLTLHSATANRPAVFNASKGLTVAPSGTDGDIVIYDSATTGGIKPATQARMTADGLNIEDDFALNFGNSFATSASIYSTGTGKIATGIDTNSAMLIVAGNFTDGSNYSQLSITNGPSQQVSFEASGEGSGATGNKIQFKTDGTERMVITNGSVRFAEAIRLSGQTAEYTDNGTTLLRNGSPIGGGGGGVAMTVSNNVVASGLLAVDSTKTNGIAATLAHITNAAGIFTGETTKFWRADGTMATLPTRTYSLTIEIQGAKLPDTSAARLSGAETNWRLLYTPASNQTADWQIRLPSNYSSGLTAKLLWSMATATANNTTWSVQVMAVTPGDSADINTESFATANTQATAVPGTAGHLAETSITLSNDDGAAAGDLVKFRVSATSATTATGDAELVGLSIDYTGP